VEISRPFYKGFFRQKCLLDQREHTRSSAKISMARALEEGPIDQDNEIMDSCVAAVECVAAV
jgi:hypothetical protein